MHVKTKISLAIHFSFLLLMASQTILVPFFWVPRGYCDETHCTLCFVTFVYGLMSAASIVGLLIGLAYCREYVVSKHV